MQLLSIYSIDFKTSDNSSDDDHNDDGWSILSPNGDYVDEYTKWIAFSISLFGIINNSSVLLLLLWQQLSPHLRILKSMAFADLCGNTVLMLLIFYPIDNGAPDGLWGEIMCRVFFSQYLLFCFSAVSCWNIVLITIDIYGGQKHESISGWYNAFFIRKWRLGFVILLTWIFGFSVMIHNVWCYSARHNECYLNWYHNALRYASGIIQCTYLIVLPPLIMITCYGKLLFKLVAAKKYFDARREVFPGQKTEMEYQMIKKFLSSSRIRIAVILAVYLLTWIPNQSVWYAYVFGFATPNIFQSWFGHITQFLPFCNSALNPIIYGWSWFEFRHVALRRIYKWCFREPNQQNIPSSMPSARTTGGFLGASASQKRFVDDQPLIREGGGGGADLSISDSSLSSSESSN